MATHKKINISKKLYKYVCNGHFSCVYAAANGSLLVRAKCTLIPKWLALKCFQHNLFISAFDWLRYSEAVR